MRRLLLPFLLCFTLPSLVGCGSISTQMKRDIRSERCATAAKKGGQWLRSSLPKKLRSAVKRPRAMQQLAAEHEAVTRQMMEALACVAIGHNTIKALRAYRKVAANLIAGVPKSLQQRLRADQVRLDRHTLDLEATLHYFQVAVPRGTPKAFRQHIELYPKSRYAAKAMQGEVDMAARTLEQEPDYERVAAFSQRYKGIKGGSAIVLPLWKASARYELNKHVDAKDVLALATFLNRYGPVADRTELDRAVTLLKIAVQAEVASIHEQVSADRVRAVLEALAALRLPPAHEKTQQWLQLREAILRRELTTVAYKDALEKGERGAYAAYIRERSRDRTAAPAIEQLQLGLAVYNQWAAMGSAPTPRDLAYFLIERADALDKPAVARLKGNPKLKVVIGLAFATAGKDECAARALLGTCSADVTWCEGWGKSRRQLNKDLRKLKRIRKRARTKAPVCKKLD